MTSPGTLRGVANWVQDPYIRAFGSLFLFRYVRSVVNAIAYYRARPTPIPAKPTYHPSDVTVVIPTVKIGTPDFECVVRTILNHPIAALIITTAGEQALSQFQEFKDKFTDSRVIHLHRQVPNRREQTAKAMPKVKTKIIILNDDHTFWPERQLFVPSLLAPFETPCVGAVGPMLEARHCHYSISFRGFWNFVGMTYLIRRGHEFIATTEVDGGISTLSSRFAVFRTEIYGDPEFLKQYLNEYIMFGTVGPLNVDDDKFHTRWLTTHNWDIKIQSGPLSSMETMLGEWPKFHDQCVRWNRTTFRSNPRVLLQEPMMWRRFPYTTYSIYLYSFVRFTLFYEITMFWTLDAGLCANGVKRSTRVNALIFLGLWILGLKVVKIIPHLQKYPSDLVYLPGYFLFAAYCSFIKIWAMFTCWEQFWATATNATNVKTTKRAFCRRGRRKRGSVN
ncbi:hypothetical protein VKT23_014483 [Stygiomarasmius scandens]|uniref:Polysaccharide synthase n=1 Tax=Marasmiellus scandens TaxID=2682957 RepID=A0ABR1IS63_9AGAR